DPFKNSVTATRPSTIQPPENVVAAEASSEPDFLPEESTYQAAPQHSESETRLTQQAVPVKTTPVLPVSPASVNEVLVREDAASVELPKITTTAAATTAAATTATRQTIVQQPQPLELEAEDFLPAPQPERSVSPVIKSVIHETEIQRSTHDFTERLTKQIK